MPDESISVRGIRAIDDNYLINSSVGAVDLEEENEALKDEIKWSRID